MSDSLVPQSAQNSTEDEVLQYTLGIRKQIIEKMTAGGKMPTDDPKSMNVILSALDGMDRSALGQKKIKSEENIAGANQAMAATIIADLLQKAGSNGVRPFTIDNPVPREAPVLPNDIPDPDLVEGETGVAPPQLSYDAFTQKYAPKDE